LAKFPPIPERLQQIDQLTVWDHPYITLNDECYFGWEYVVKGGYVHYDVNDFIQNFEIPSNWPNPLRLRHKRRAIAFAGKALQSLIPADLKQTSTFVPIPPSKIKGDPAHDERLSLALRSIAPPLADVRELVLQNENTISKGKQIPPSQRAANYRINEECALPDPTHIVLVDDVLTTGSHFKGAMMVLQQHYPNVGIVGLFLARAIRPDVIPETTDDEIAL
jgi:hypothetical protein